MPADEDHDLPLANILNRLKHLEEWKQEQMIASAVRTEQALHFEDRFNSLDKRVDKGFDRLDGLVSRIVWLIVTGLILGVLGFVLKGGLTLVS